MPEHDRARTLVAVLALVALVVLTLDFRQGSEGALAALRRGALTVFAPVQDGFAAVVRPLGDIVAAIGQVGDLRARNALLAGRVEQLEQERPVTQELLRENEELRALLGMRDRLALETVAAEVIGRSPGASGFSATIDAGAAQGLRPGMAVLDARGLVGKLTTVVPDYAQVELVSSPDARYAVRTALSGHTGLLQGQGAQPFLLEMRDPSVEVAAGEQVVTRTFEGSTIPGGIPVGALTDDEQPSPRYRAVRPYVDFTNLSLVQVVTNAPDVPTQLPTDEAVPAPPRPRPRIDPTAVPAPT